MVYFVYRQQTTIEDDGGRCSIMHDVCGIPAFFQVSSPPVVLSTAGGNPMLGGGRALMTISAAERINMLPADWALQTLNE
jgi:hypothetical protein